MNTIRNKKIAETELPMQFEISFGKVFSVYEKYASQKHEKSPYHQAAKEIVIQIEKCPELITGFADFSLLEKHKEQVDLLTAPLFPEALTLNEIKAACVPFSFETFKVSDRFEKILNDAGDDYQLKMHGFEENNRMTYIHACSMILAVVYGYSIDLKRPFIFEIPDKGGKLKHYRAAFNADFSEIIATENAPKITREDFELLIDSYDDVELWKEKFPPNSYVFKGFGLISLFDVTTDVTITAIRSAMLRRDETVLSDVQENLRSFYGIDDLEMGFSVFEQSPETLELKKVIRLQSLFLNDDLRNCNDNFLCTDILQKTVKDLEPTSIANVERYGEQTEHNALSKVLKKKGIGSILIIPIKAKNVDNLALLEISSPRPFELNSLVAHKLKDVIPVIQTVMERASKDRDNELEATIQEYYTSIHPSVKWRFLEAAEKYHFALHKGESRIKLDEIQFDDVYPLFGQSDIKGSSTLRNVAIQKDLTTQLTMAVKVLKKAAKTERMPIYDALIFRIKEYSDSVQNGLKAGDETEVLDFLNREIYPTFNHIKEIDESLATSITEYMNGLDDQLGVVYDKRKDYDTSVTYLNDKLSHFLEAKQEEAQSTFPHYFEQYKTDGVEYNMYIGKSLVKHRAFERLYLSNLRLWQLQLMFEMENVANSARQEMKHHLEIASLILVHSTPLNIKFRMEEKQFDVDGAYNIRYEIIKKRIDKAHIKGGNDRLTVPGKIAIVYSQDKDAEEYVKYIHYLQSKNQLGKIEYLELEELQGASGLKALRVEVIYQEDYKEESAISFDELIESIED